MRLRAVVNAIFFVVRRSFFLCLRFRKEAPTVSEVLLFGLLTKNKQNQLFAILNFVVKKNVKHVVVEEEDNDDDERVKEKVGCIYLFACFL